MSPYFRILWFIIGLLCQPDTKSKTQSSKPNDNRFKSITQPELYSLFPANVARMIDEIEISRKIRKRMQHI